MCIRDRSSRGRAQWPHWTGDAELGAVVRGVAESDGVASIPSDFQIDAKVRLKSDASAAVGITQRLGLGRVRHLAVSDLWIQQRVRSGAVSIEKLPGLENPADLLTKALDGPRIAYLLLRCGLGAPMAYGRQADA